MSVCDLITAKIRGLSGPRRAGTAQGEKATDVHRIKCNFRNYLIDYIPINCIYSVMSRVLNAKFPSAAIYAALPLLQTFTTFYI